MPEPAAAPRESNTGSIMRIPMRTRAAILSGAGVALVALAASPGAAEDPAPASRPSFEVVSIKPRGPVLPVQDSEGRWTQSTTSFQYSAGRLAVTQTLSRIDESISGDLADFPVKPETEPVDEHLLQHQARGVPARSRRQLG